MEKPALCLLCESKKLSAVFNRDEDTLWSCESCRVVFAWPQIQEMDLHSYYACVTDPNYIVKYEKEAKRRGERILRFVEKKIKSGKILDVGCGCGFFLSVAQHQGWEAMGVEIAQPMIALSRKFGDFKIVEGDFNRVKDSLPAFPVISIQHILEHVKDPKNFLQTLLEKLEPGGILAVAVPNWDGWMRLWAGSQWVCLRERGHLFHFTVDVLKKLLEQIGLRVLYWETPQWNSLDLIWAWRRRKEKVSSVSAGEGQCEGKTPELFSAPSWLRQTAALGARPVAWLAQKMSRGAEILMLAEKK